MSWVAAAFRSVGVARGFLELGLCFFAATDFFMFFPWLWRFQATAVQPLVDVLLHYTGKQATQRANSGKRSCGLRRCHGASRTIHIAAKGIISAVIQGNY
jgi:hypothetical protein